MMKLNIQLFAVPFRKVSKTRKRMRRAHNAMEMPGVTKCSTCGEVTNHWRMFVWYDIFNILKVLGGNDRW